MSLAIDRQDAASDMQDRTLTTVQPDISDVVGIARRGWLPIVAGTALGLVAALALLSLVSPKYKANVDLVVERGLKRYLQSSKLIDEPAFDDSDIWSQIRIISSESIILPVIRSLNLTSDPEFGGKDAGDANAAPTPTLSSRVKSFLGSKPAPVVRSADPERVAFEALTRNLYVYRQDGPFVFGISYESKDPQKAAKIANAIAETYLSASVTAKINSTQTVNKLVQDRLAELKSQLNDAESALTQYKMANNLIGIKDKTISSEQLDNLSTHLATARVEIAEGKARLSRYETSNDSATLVPDNDLILRLRSQYLDLSSRAQEIESKVGKTHEAAIKNQKKMEAINVAIRTEQKRLARSFGRDHEVTKARYTELASTAAEVLTEQSATSLAQARMRELETAADTLRKLYNTTLQRFSETSKADAQPLISADARIITRAAPPSQSEASKRKLILLAGSSLLGMLLGIAAVFARDFPFGVFRAPAQVRRATGLYCAALPDISSDLKGGNAATTGYVLDRPKSRYTDSLRNVWALIKNSQRHDNAAKVFCVVSSVPQEGKTAIATNLAYLASHAGTRTLLIDADFRDQTLTRALTPTARSGLIEALDNPAQLPSFVVKMDGSPVDVLCCPLDTNVENASDLLGSARMEKLLATARQTYDVILLTVAPMATVADFNMISRMCDKYIFVVKWGKTSQRLVLETLSDNDIASDKALCVILNEADPAALLSVEHYKGRAYRDYYRSGVSGPA